MKNLQATLNEKQRQFKKGLIPRKTQAGHLDHHIQCPTVQVVLHKSLIMT